MTAPSPGDVPAELARLRKENVRLRKDIETLRAAAQKLVGRMGELQAAVDRRDGIIAGMEYLMRSAGIMEPKKLTGEPAWPRPPGHGNA